MEEAEKETSNSTRVQVVVRVRPLLPKEIQHEVAVKCNPDGDKIQVSLPHRNSDKELLPGTNRAGAKSFRFDACLPGSTTQDDLFETCGMQDLVEAALDGYSVTIFAFGQTGSGKTHTMIGPRLSRGIQPGDESGGGANDIQSEDGVLPRCVLAAFESIKLRKEEADFTVTASCLELYNETVTDLLGSDKTKQMQMRKDDRDGFQVVGLTQMTCPTAQATLKHMQRALALRQTRAHRLNDYSSRSHCMMTFVFSSKTKGEAAEKQQGAQGGIRRYGKLVLVDLAGSERLKETGNTDRDAVRETGCINKSLFTLGQVLAALCSRSSLGSGTIHIPYRDSKLTQLLWDGLRGTGRSLMLACLGPTIGFAEESLNTLHFASMAQRIKAAPVILLDPQDQLVLDLRNMIKQLQEENKQLATSLQHLSTGGDISSVIESLPEKLRAAMGPGSTPGTAPPLIGGSDARGSRVGVRENISQGGSNSTPDTPWRSAYEPVLPPTPKSANIFKLQPLPKNGGGARGRGNSRGSLSQGYGASAAATEKITRQESGPGQFNNPNQFSPATSSSPWQAGRQTRALSQPRSEPRRLANPKSAWGTPESGPNSMQHTFQDLSGAGLRSPLTASLNRPPKLGGAVSLAGGRGYANPKLTAIGRPSNSKSPAGFMPDSKPENLLRPPSLDPVMFPELAALEAEFQQSLTVEAVGGSGQQGYVKKVGAQEQQGPDGSGGSKKSAPKPSVSAKDQGPGSDVAALKWASKNKWFGTDRDMTNFAYQVHDLLVDVEKMDPSSDLYYLELERRVAKKYPDIWAKEAQSQQGQAGRQGQAGTMPLPAETSAAQAFSRALRVALKDPLPSHTLSSQTLGIQTQASSTHEGGKVHGFMNMNRSSTTAASLVVTGSSPSSSMPQAVTQTSKPYSGSSTLPVMPEGKISGSKGSASVDDPVASTSSSFNPFNLHALNVGPLRLHAPVTSKVGSRRKPSAAVAAVKERVRSQLLQDPFELTSYESMQQEYLRQRALVVNELRQAKEEAEQERTRIMAKIGNMLGSSRWRK